MADKRPERVSVGDVDLRSRVTPGTLELDADCNASVTTTSLLRDSTLDSVTTPPCGCLQPAALLDDPPLEPISPGLQDLASSVVDTTAADMENWKPSRDLLRDATASSRRVVADDVMPEPEILCTGSGAVFPEVDSADVVPEPEVVDAVR